MLHRAVGVQEIPAQVHNGLSLPAHNQPWRFCDDGNLIGFQIFSFGGGDKFLCILRRDHNGHTLLTFGDGQLGAVQTVVFLPHRVQVNDEAVRQLADGHGHAPAPKSLQRLISRVTSPFRNRR